MTKAKLIKKDSPKREQLEKARKQRKSRAQQVSPPKSGMTALEFTTEWIKKRREDEFRSARGVRQPLCRR